MENVYFVSGFYQTAAGNLSRFTMPNVRAVSFDALGDIVRAALLKDRRRTYARALSFDAVAVRQ